MSKQENEISEPHYEALCQMTRHIVGLYFPHNPQDFEDRFWLQAQNWANAYEIPFARLKAMSDRGLILRREVENGSGFPRVQYAISFETYKSVRKDIWDRATALHDGDKLH